MPPVPSDGTVASMVSVPVFRHSDMVPLLLYPADAAQRVAAAVSHRCAVGASLDRSRVLTADHACMPLPPECAGRGDHDVADRPAVGCEEPGISVPERNPEAGDGEVAAVIDALQFRDRRPLGVEQVDVALLEVFAPPAGVVEVDHLQFGDRVDGDEALVVRLAEGYFPVDDPEADLAALLPPDLVLRAVAGDPGDDADRNPGLLHGLALCIEGDLRGAVRPGQVNFDGAVFHILLHRVMA